jgi:ABC-type polysaccharide/polyol phosphate export permease
MLAAVTQHRNVLWNLTLREIRVRYKQSLLGVVWALFVPLAMMLTFALVFSRITGVADTFATTMPYPIFLYIGLLPWVFFAQSMNAATNSLVANRNLVTKIYFPREVFPLSAILSCLFDFALASTVLVGLFAYYDLFTPWSFHLHGTALWVPVGFGVQLIFMAGLALWFSLANLFFRDVKYLVTVLLQLWMFLTNVIYPLPAKDPLVLGLINANPMTPIIATYRRGLIDGLAPEPGPFLAATIISLLVLLTGWRVFRGTEHKFAECI